MKLEYDSIEKLQEDFLNNKVNEIDFVDTYNDLLTKESAKYAKADLVGEHAYD